jgi:D-glycero-D-manno-heptose 1,7-bisphosphate phosphatase
VSPDEVIVVGDSLRDLQAAEAAGARPILVRTGNGTATETRLTKSLEATPVFDDLAALARHLGER